MSLIHLCISNNTAGAWLLCNAARPHDGTNSPLHNTQAEADSLDCNGPVCIPDDWEPDLYLHVQSVYDYDTCTAPLCSGGVHVIHLSNEQPLTCVQSSCADK